MSQVIRTNIEYSKNYAIHIGKNLENEFRNFCSARYSPRKLFVVVDERVDKLHHQKIDALCSGYFEKIYYIPIPEGEKSKSIIEWSKITDRILNDGVERGTPLLAVGGGVTGDLAGFAAASILRGLPLIHFPTTLLAMVDSSIGGKTGVNHTTGKNLIGAFYQPDAVFADIDFLETLEQKEWINGLAEILKYAAIRNPELFERLEIMIEEGFNPSDEWIEVIAESAQIKVDIVEEDTLEAGKRAFLNFGHTFGHALENISGYGDISHGQAVFVGMMAAGYLSEKLGFKINKARFNTFLPLYSTIKDSLPTNSRKLIEAMKSDKKVKNNIIRLILLEKWGKPFIYECDNHDMLFDAWDYALTEIR